jgi:uroporphyrin-III C-methyltransferase
MTGRVYLVGAGPGDPELLTQKAARLLRGADMILHDDLVTPEILALAPATAEIRSVGKRCGTKQIAQEEIHALMIAHARAGKTVIRLKGGDPAVFSRAGEEIDALRAADIRYEIVPGVTAASAAAAAAGIPLTDRRAASKLMFLTPHNMPGFAAPEWPKTIPPQTTIVVYMPSGRYEEIAQDLMGAGVDPETPCLVVSQTSTAGEEIMKTRLNRLGEACKLPAPSVLLIGDVAANARASIAEADSATAEKRVAQSPQRFPAVFQPKPWERALAHLSEAWYG